VSYQRPLVPLKQSIVKDMNDSRKYKTYLGNEKYYHDFLVYFQEEMDQKGWQEVLNQYMFKGDELADDMLVRMFGGILHPIIHLGFGVEFEQPAIIAEALAQAAVHDNREAAHLVESEKAAKDHSPVGGSRKTIVQLLGEIYAEKKGRTKYASQVYVTEENLEEKTAEMINANGTISSRKLDINKHLTDL
jgi:Questin oxidase-like